MLKSRSLLSAALLAAGLVACARGGQQTAIAELPQRPSVSRPEWLDLVADEIEAVRACIGARAPELAMAVHVQPLNDLRTGVITLGLDGSVERCVHRVDIVEYRARAHDVGGEDFAGEPAVSTGASRPSSASDAYIEEVVRGGVTVAWVQWLGKGGGR